MHGALQSQIWTPQNGAHRKLFPTGTPSCKLTPRPRSKHEKRTAGSAWETWTVAAGNGVRFARVRWEINFLLTFETAPFICKHSVLQFNLCSLSFFLAFILRILWRVQAVEIDTESVVDTGLWFDVHFIVTVIRNTSVYCVDIMQTFLCQSWR